MLSALIRWGAGARRPPVGGPVPRWPRRSVPLVLGAPSPQAASAPGR